MQKENEMQFNLGELARAMVDVRQTLNSEQRRLPEARGQVPQTFLDVLAKLAGVTPFYGGIIRASDRQAITGHVTRIALAMNGDLRHAELEIIRLIEDGAEPPQYHEDRVPLSDIAEIRFYQHVALRAPVHMEDADA